MQTPSQFTIQDGKTPEQKIIDDTQVLQTMMALVRCGYQQAADEVHAYLNERKVTPDFMDGIMRLLDPENKKAFVYEVFAKELEDLKTLAGVAIPTQTAKGQEVDQLELWEKVIDHMDEYIERANNEYHVVSHKAIERLLTKYTLTPKPQ